jgi:fumarate reductase subunit C
MRPARVIATMDSSHIKSPATASRGPAWLDLIQGFTGLLLVLFMWAHMFFVSSILLGTDAMYAVARMFEGEFIFGKPYPLLVTGAAAGVFVLFVAHAVVAIRKIPSSYREYRSVLRHASVFRHADTNLWLVQVVTGLLLMFLGFAHLYQMMAHPADIGPYASADRVWSGHWWPLYLFLLVMVEVHGGIGLYRLALKWGWVKTTSGSAARTRLRRVKWGITSFFLILGVLTLAAYMKLGYEHRHAVGERYVPEQRAD